MSVETYQPTNKEVALLNLEQTLKLYPTGGETDEEGQILDNAYRLADESGATTYDIKHLEFSLLPEGERQDQLNLEARHDLEYRIGSLEHGEELFETYIRIRNEFGLQDPYVASSQKK